VKLTTHPQLVPRSRKCGSTIYTLPHTPSWRIAELVKHRNNFIFLPFKASISLEVKRFRFIRILLFSIATDTSIITSIIFVDLTQSVPFKPQPKLQKRAQAYSSYQHCLNRCFHVKPHTAKYFTNSSKWF
jgi:hypothetical protein